MKKIPRQILWVAGIVIVLASAAVVAMALVKGEHREHGHSPAACARKSRLTVHATGGRATHTIR
jgi:hypothetical protein